MLFFKIYVYYSELDLGTLWSLGWRFCTKGWMLSAGGYCDKGRGLRCCGGPVLSAVYSFLLKSSCFAILLLIIICYDCVIN